jgi:hypothetical protein
MDLSICIPSWNTRDLLAECLDSLPDGGVRDHEVIVADNGSNDGTLEMLRRRRPAVRLIANSHNLGYARANNQMLAVARGRYVLLLNSDTRVRPGALARLVGFLDSHPEAGAAGPRLLNTNGRLERSWGRAGPCLLEEVGRALLLDRLFRVAPVQPFPVGRLTGAALLVRAIAARQVGPLDTRFAHYAEDADWCWRLRRCGWQLFFVPTATIIHRGGASSQRAAGECFRLYFGTKRQFFAKHHGPAAGAALRSLLFFECLAKGAAWRLLADRRGRGGLIGGDRARAYWAVVGDLLAPLSAPRPEGRGGGPKGLATCREAGRLSRWPGPCLPPDSSPAAPVTTPPAGRVRGCAQEQLP